MSIGQALDSGMRSVGHGLSTAWNWTSSKVASGAKAVWPVVQKVAFYVKEFFVFLFVKIKQGVSMAYGAIMAFAKTNPLGFKIAAITGVAMLVLGIIIGYVIKACMKSSDAAAPAAAPAVGGDKPSCIARYLCCKKA